MMKTSETKAYNKLKALIIEGELPLGEFLSQRMLAEKAGTSVATVRNSLRFLESEGLIENVPRWGVRIHEETEEQIRDRYFVRELLETGAIARIIEERSPEVRKRLEELGRICDAVTRDSSEAVKEFAEAHMNFHLAIAEYSHSTLLLESIKRLNFMSLMLHNAKRGWGMNKGAPPNCHYKFARNIFECSPGEVDRMAREHVRDGLKNEMEALSYE